MRLPSSQRLFESIHTPVSREWGEEGDDNPVFIDGKKSPAVASGSVLGISMTRIIASDPGGVPPSVFGWAPAQRTDQSGVEEDANSRMVLRHL